MANYHINPETGRPNQCTAKIKCRFGADTKHYSSKEEARTGYESDMASQTVSSSLKKTSTTSAVTSPSASAVAFDYRAVETAAKEIEDVSNGAVSLRLSNFSDEDGSELLVVFNAEHDLCMVIEKTDKGENFAYTGYGPDYRVAREPLSQVLTPTQIDQLASENEDYPHNVWEDGPSPASQQIVKIINDVANKDSSAVTPAPVAAKPVTKSVPPAAPAKLAVIPGVPALPTKEELDYEEMELQDELHGYTVRGILNTRHIDLSDIEEEERDGNYTVTVKVPSYYEVDISTDLARRELGLPSRAKTGIDESPLRVAEIAKNNAYSKTFGIFHTREAADEARAKYAAARDEFLRLREELKNTKE